MRAGHIGSLPHHAGRPAESEKGGERFADPEDKAYPVDTPEERRAAAGFLAMHGGKYSPEKREEIARNIDNAKDDE